MLNGVIDIHVHPGPSIFPRSVDDFQLATQAGALGMRAIVLKSHEESTVSRARLVAGMVAGIDVYGSLVLNDYVGGLNPFAVDLAIRMGAKIVWMPTVSAKQHLDHYGGHGYREQKSAVTLLPQKGITILSPKGNLFPVVYDIIDLIKEGDIVLATGHLSPRETVLLVKTARERGLSKVLVTHPDLLLNRMNMELQYELANTGAFLEKSMLSLLPAWKSIEPEELVKSMRNIGLERCVLVTDLGQVDQPPPGEGYHQFLQLLLHHGLKDSDLEVMACSNPSFLLGLS
ncbi:MAG TPA: DUF6282 family protein [Spirochaetia bacterium]|nr:DUF6282 family protein [Spirochaetia bacterium]